MSEKEPATIVDSGEETKLLHERYLAAVNNPSRRRILEALRKGGLTAEERGTITELNAEALRWHLSLLESVRCVETENATGNLVYRLTQAGRAVEFME